MNRLTVQPVIAVLILFPAAVKSAKGNVEFGTENVTLTCPKDGQWFSKEGGSLSTDNKSYNYQYEGRSTSYCQYDNGNSKYYFYVRGKTCRDCFELDATLLLRVLVVNLIMTIVVMVVVYKCTKRRMSAVSKKAPQPAGGPPTPSRDYEELNPRTRSKDTYSLVNRTG